MMATMEQQAGGMAEIGGGLPGWLGPRPSGGTRPVVLYTLRDTRRRARREGRYCPTQLSNREDAEHLNPGQVETAHILNMTSSLFLCATVTNGLVTDLTESVPKSDLHGR